MMNDKQRAEAMAKANALRKKGNTRLLVGSDEAKRASDHLANLAQEEAQMLDEQLGQRKEY